jgi:hypothetical protein
VAVVPGVVHPIPIVRMKMILFISRSCPQLCGQRG